MAKLAIFFALAAAALVAVSASHKPHTVAKAPPPVDEPYTGFDKFVKSCKSKLTKKCGSQIHDAIFNSGPMRVSCCVELVDMGQLCHREIMKANLLRDYESLPSYKWPNKYVKLADDLWAACVDVMND